MKWPSPIEFSLLAVLGSQEMSGREIAEAFKAEHARSISYGTLYTALRRLKEAGWIEVREDADADGRLKFFKLTGSGRATIRSALQAHQRVSTATPLAFA
jgi:DNA-binding PadR family transcriptional regulator